MVGPEDGYTLRTQNNLANLLRHEGNLREAEALCRQTLGARRRVNGSDHPDTRTVEVTLGQLLADDGKPEEAEKLFREVLGAQRKILRADHPGLATTLACLGSLLTDNRRSAEAEPLLRECLAIREKKLPASHRSIACARSLLGGCLVRQKKFAEAEPLVLAGCEGLAKEEGHPAKQVAEAVNRVIELYEKWGKPEQAEAWRKKRPDSGKSTAAR